MNCTLTRLSLALNLGSPILSFPRTLSRKSFGILSLFASKSSSPFLIGSSSSICSLTDSHFASFLSPVIYITGISQIIINDTSSLSIKGTLFENSSIDYTTICAIIHVANGWLVTITDCLFKNNFGKLKSSSIYAVLSVMNVSCSIFTKCWSTNIGDFQCAYAFYFLDCISKVNDCLFYQSGIDNNCADGVYSFYRGKSITKRVNSTDCKTNSYGESAGTAVFFTGDTYFEFIHGEGGTGHNSLMLLRDDQIMRYVDTFNIINGTYDYYLLYSRKSPVTYTNGFLFGNNRNNLGTGIKLVDCFGDFNITGVTKVSPVLTHSISFDTECRIFPTASFSFKPFVRLPRNRV